MQTILYTELNGFGLAILLLIFFNIRSRTNRYLLDQKLFIALLYTTAIILVLDSIMWIVDDIPGQVLRILYLVTTVLYYSLNPVICVIWFLYVDYYINRDSIHIRKLCLPAFFPVAVNLILSILSISENIMFYIDENGRYYRGRFFFILPAICLFFLIYPGIYTVVHRKDLHPREFAILMFFPVPPIIGAILQTLFYGLSLIWICTTLSLLLIFVNFQNDQMSIDHLTGVYNRRQLDSFLHAKSQSTGSKFLAGLMIDLNSFKSINDTYSHSVGDKTLQIVAEILRNTFRKNDFVARYGGDEFVVIFEIADRPELDRAVSRLNENVACFNAQKQLPFPISLSVGYDEFLSKKESSDEFLKHLDELMYIDKHKLQEPMPGA